MAATIKPISHTPPGMAACFPLSRNLRDFVTPVSGDLWERTPTIMVLMNAENRYHKTQDVKPLNSRQPVWSDYSNSMMVVIHPEDADLSKGVMLRINGLDNASVAAMRKDFTRRGIALSDNGYVINTVLTPRAFSKQQAVPGACNLKINAKQTLIAGYERAGVFYGL